MPRFRWLGLLVILAIALTVASTASAYAYLRGVGRGTGTVPAGTLLLQVEPATAGDANTGLLLPGGRADAIVRVHNPNRVSVLVIGVRGNGRPVASNGCAPTGVSFTDQSLRTTVPAGASMLLRLSGAVAMDLSAAASCQGVGFSIPVSVTARR
jgi:hypothetical protein